MPPLPPNVHRLPQSAFRAIPGARWVYWIGENIIQIFTDLPPIGEFAEARRGLASGDNTRFYHYWWEVGRSLVGMGRNNGLEAASSGMRWFPLMKEGKSLKWYGNQDYVVNWEANGAEIRSIHTAEGRLASCPRNVEFYFREGVTWGTLTSKRLSVRFMPIGFIFSDKGDSAFSDSPLSLLAVLNSTLAAHLVRLMAGTLDLTCGTIAEFPLVSPPDTIASVVTNCIRIQKKACTIDETTHDFLSPPHWPTGLQDLAAAQSRLANLESQIDDEVYRLYGIGEEDREAIEAELRGGPGVEAEENGGGAGEQGSRGAESEEVTEPSAPMTRQELAVRWVSYAVGNVMGRFQPGVAGALGRAVVRREDFAVGSLPAPEEAEFNELVGPPERFAYVERGASSGERLDDAASLHASLPTLHVFPAEVEAKLRALADADGIVVLDDGHPDDLPKKVETGLELMLGEQGAAEVVAALSGDNSSPVTRHSHFDRAALRKFLERDFFSKWHVKWYRKRPVYWLLQSPKKLYGVYLFHERITKDTLYVVQRDYLDAKLNLTRQLLEETREAAGRGEAASSPNARERRALNKKADELEKLLADLEEFARRMKAVTDRGYDPDINDGVILNMAPLWEVIPAWSKEPLKYWEGLERGDYDWAHIAMKHWPERVQARCRADKSLAIAHGVG